MTEVPWSVVARGLRLRVRLTPRGGRDVVEGIAHRGAGGCVLEVRVRAAPTDGTANSALVRLIAAALAVAPRQVRVEAGATARLKTLEIAGDGAALAGRLASRMNGPGVVG